MNPLKIGLFGIGLDAYWPQFAGLKERLEGYLDRVQQQAGASRASVVVNLGLIDTPEKAFEAGHAFRQADVDLIFLHVTTYALSSTVLPVVRRAKVPVIILNLQPGPAIDYASFNRMGDRTRMTGEWLAYCSACPVPEIASVFNRARIPFHQVTGMLDDDPACWDEVAEWIEAARVAHVMEHNRLGVMGHYYCGMLDIYSDLTQQCAHFGGHIEIVEVDELAHLRTEVSEPEIDERVALFHQAFDVQPDCPPAELERAARTSVALDRLVEQHRLGSLAYYYMGVGNPANEDAISSIILGTSLLTGRGIPVAGEMEIKNVQAMKILDSFGAGGSFTEYYAHGLSRRRRAHGPRRARAHRHRRRQDQGPARFRSITARSAGGCRWRCRCATGRSRCSRSFRRSDGRLELQVAEGESVAGPDPGDRQHQQPLSVLPGRAAVRRGMEPARPGAPLRRRRWPPGLEDREAGEPAGAEDHAGVLTR